MGWFRRSALVLSIALVSVAGQVVSAAANAHGPTAGTTSRSGFNADFQHFPADGSMPQISISVSAFTNTSRPLGGVATTTSEIDLNLNLFDGQTNSYGCFLLGATEFNIAADLSTASLHTVLNESSPVCEGSFVSAVFPISIDATWTSVGPLNSFRGTGHSACSGFHEESSNSFDSSPATASATLSSDQATGSFDSTGGSALSSSQGQDRVEGTAATLCAIGGRGSGPGGLPAGTYRNSNGGAVQQLVEDSTGQFMQIAVSQFVNSSNPRVGRATSSSRTTVQINLEGPDVFASGCFVIDPGDFTMKQSLSSASLHTTITAANATCGPDNDFTSLPLTIDMTWTGIGPLASVDNHGVDTCASLRTETSATQQNNNTSAVAILSGAMSGSFTSHQSANESTGGMGSEDTISQVQGVASPGCEL